jgi:hypothetical protein
MAYVNNAMVTRRMMKRRPKVGKESGKHYEAEFNIYDNPINEEIWQLTTSD